jgi:PTS system glucose-specific IIA component
MPVRDILRNFLTSRTSWGKFVAPVTGRTIHFEQMADEVFSSKLLGEGLAFIPHDGRLCAPADGEVTKVSSAGRIIRIDGKDGISYLLQVGWGDDAEYHIDMVTVVQKGTYLKSGEIIGTFSEDKVKAMGANGVIILSVTRLPAKRKLAFTGPEYVVAGKDEIMSIEN